MWAADSRGRTATKTDPHRDLLVRFGQRDIGDEQCHHALAFPIGSRRMVPHGGKAGRQRADALRGGLVERGAIRGALAFHTGPQVLQRLQALIPGRFEGRGDQTIRRIDLHVAPPRAVHLVVRPFDLLATHAIGFLAYLAYDDDLEQDRRDLEHFEA